MISDKIKNKALELYKNGMSYREAAMKFGFSDEPLRKYAIKNGINSRNKTECQQKYKVNSLFFDNIDTEQKAYFLGFLYADGTISPCRNSIILSLKEDDREILEKLKIAIESNRPLKYRVRNPNWKGSHIGSKNTWVLLITNKNIVEKLQNIGCTNNKTYTATFPEIPKEFQRHFIRGYFDGDGCISSRIQKGSINLCYRFDLAGNQDFLKSVQDILMKSIGLNSTKICLHNGISNLIYGGNNNCRKIKNFLYQNSTIYLERKFDKFKLL